MKKVRKILPVSLSDIWGLEKWLEDQADNGLFPISIGSLATFTANGVPGTRFRLEPYGKCQDAPSEEQIALYQSAGWEYAFAVGSIYFLFYTTDPAAVELYSDHESRGLSLERLEKAVRRARRRTVITDIYDWADIPVTQKQPRSETAPKDMQSAKERNASAAIARTGQKNRA